MLDVTNRATGLAMSDNPMYQQLYDQSQAPSEVSDYYRGVMGGNTRDNPFFQGMLDRVGDQVRSIYSATGRYGSRAHNRGMAEGLTPLLYQNMQDAYGREMGAAGALGGFQNQRLGMGANIAGMLDQSRLGNIGAAYQGQAGVQGINQAQQEADYNRALWELGGGENWALDNYLNRVSSIGSMGGTGTAVTQEPRRPGERIIGGLLTGLGMFV